MTNPHPGGPRAVRRGEIYIADLHAVGGPLWKRRPAVVIQNDLGNRHSAETIVAAVRTASPHRLLLPVHVPVAAGVAGLVKDSRIDLAQILTVSKEALQGPIGSLPPDVMAAVDRALRISLGLQPQ